MTAQGKCKEAHTQDRGPHDKNPTPKVDRLVAMLSPHLHPPTILLWAQFEFIINFKTAKALGLSVPTPMHRYWHKADTRSCSHDSERSLVLDPRKRIITAQV